MARGKVKPTTASEPVEGRWTLPSGWRWARARDFARIVGGSTPKNASDLTNFDPSGTPWVTPADLSGYKQPTISAGRRNLAAHLVNPASILPVGTVLISSRAPVGYCAVTASRMATNQGFRSLVLGSDIDPFFIRYYVLYSRDYLEANASGTTFKELSGSALGDLLFPLPPIELQKAIAARIDELFTEVDDGEAALERARGDLATWRKALLKAAVTGELTADWRAANPPTETGADLLARILAERRARWLAEPRNKGKRYIEPEGVETTGQVTPDGWALTGAGPLLTWASGKFLPDRLMSGAAIPVYGGNGIAGHHHEWLVDRPTLVIGRVGFYCGNAYVTDGLAWITDNAIYASTIDSSVDPRFIRIVFEQANLRVRAQGGAQPFVSQGLLNSVAIPLPGLSEQEQIVEQVDSLMSEAVALTKTSSLLEEASATLRQSILAAAFRGDLVA